MNRGKKFYDYRNEKTAFDRYVRHSAVVIVIGMRQQQ